MKRILDCGETALRYGTLWDLKFASANLKRKLFGWILEDCGNRLIECYPGGRMIDWTRVWRECGGRWDGKI